MSNLSNIQNKEDIAKNDFAELYGPLMPSIRKIKRIAHFASFITQAFALYKISESSFTGMQKVSLIVLSLSIAIGIGLFIEGGISKIFPIWSRQLIRWKFKNRWYFIMFIVITAIVVPLIIFSPTLSGYGAAESVEQVTPTTNRESSTQVELLYIAQKDSVNNKSDLQIEKSNARFADRISSIQKKYSSLIHIQDAKYNKHKNLDNNGHPWAKSHMDSATKENRRLKSMRDAEIDVVKQEQLQVSTLLEEARLLALSSIDQDKKRQLDIIDQEYETANNKRSSFVGLWRSIGWYLAGFASLVVVVCIFIIEVYRAGAGQDYKKFVDKESDSHFDKLFRAIDNRVNSLLEGATNGILHGFKIEGGGVVQNNLFHLPKVVSNNPKQKNETSETTNQNKSGGVATKTAETLVKQQFQDVSPKLKQDNETSETIIIVNQSPRYIKQKYTQAWRRSKSQKNPETPLKNMKKYAAILAGMGIEPFETGDIDNPIGYNEIV